MEKETVKHHQALAAEKFKTAWADMRTDLQSSKAATELRLQMEFLETKQGRLFKDFGKAAYISGTLDFNAANSLKSQIEVIEHELLKKYAALQKLKSI